MKQALIDNLTSLYTIFGVNVSTRAGVNRNGYSWFSILNLDTVIKAEDGTEMTILEWFTQHMTDKVYSWIIQLTDGKVISYTLDVRIADKTSYLDKETNRTIYHTKTSVSFSEESGTINSDEKGLLDALTQTKSDWKLTQDSQNKVATA